MLEQSNNGGIETLFNAKTLGDLVPGTGGGSRYTFVAHAHESGDIAKVAVRIKKDNDVSIRVEFSAEIQSVKKFHAPHEVGCEG